MRAIEIPQKIEEALCLGLNEWLCPQNALDLAVQHFFILFTIVAIAIPVSFILLIGKKSLLSIANLL